MENRSVALLIGAFVAIIIGVSLIGSVATQGQEVTKLTSATDTLDLSTFARQPNFTILGNTTNLAHYNSVTWKINDADCNIVASSVRNATATAGVLTVNTDYVLTNDGVIKFLTTAKTAGFGNATTVDYTYCEDNYMTEGWSRTVLNMVAGFFAIALMAVGVGLMYQVLKNEGLANL